MAKKICVVVASRANYARIKSVLRAINEHPKLKLQLVVSGSALLDRFGSAIKIIQKDGFKPDARVYIVIEGENPTTMAKSTGLAIVELATIFENLKPDIVLTVADRYETISTAIAASYMNIPVAHTQGGEVSGSIDESVRHAVTKLSHIHFVATEASRRNLIKMGENPRNVFLTGCPSLDLLLDGDLSKNDKVFKQHSGVGPPLDFSKPYLIVVQHPVTTEYSKARWQITQTLRAIYELKMQTVWLWPNIDAGSDEIAKGIRCFRERYNPGNIEFFINFSPEDYACLLNNCQCIVGNSSSGIREAVFLGVPAVNIGTRQEGREKGSNVIDVAHDKIAIKEAILKQVKHGRYQKSKIFGDGKAGRRIADILSKCDIRVQKKLVY
jgi:UDP-hydrolysing UDP-N-acetyl-D-glucosamine 2-epimerase